MGKSINVEEGNPIFSPVEDMIGVCACCDTKENTTLCRYVCKYRPRPKDIIRLI